MYWRRHPEGRGWERQPPPSSLWNRERAWSSYLTIWKLTLQYKGKNPDSCVKTLDDSLFGASLVKCNFRALSVISNKILPLGLIRWELSSFLLWIWLKWAEKWDFLSGCLGEGVTWLQGQTPAPERLTKALSAWITWGPGRASGENEAQELWATGGTLLLPYSAAPPPNPPPLLLYCFNFPPLLKQSRRFGF